MRAPTISAVQILHSRAWSSAARRRLSLVVAVLLCGSRAFGAQTDIDISKAAPSAIPRIIGQSIVGTKPGSPFLFTIAATGQAPLAFTATGLPAGLALEPSTGTVSGTSPVAGSYPVTFEAKNAAGEASATLIIASGPTLALSPPMGWNSYDSFGGSVKEDEVMAAAQAMGAQLRPFGWNAVIVDFLWYDPEQNIDASGRYLPSPSKFPSATGELGFKPLADKIHALGLSFGIHIMRGIPRKSVTANTPVAGTNFTASQAGDTNDPCPWDNHMWGVRGDTDAGKAWYNSIFAQYAQWGIDFVKVDDMVNPYSNPLDYHGDETDAIRAAIDKTGRSIVLSLSPGPMQTRDASNLNANANMWRIVNDFWDNKGLSSVSDVFNAANSWQATPGLQVGHWPDADMLPLGYIGPRCPVHSAGPSAFSHNQQITVMSLWSILPSPLMLGGNPTHLMDDAWSIALLTNEEVLAVNQDVAGTHAKRVAKQGNTEVWSRDLANERKAVALFNRGTDDAMVSVTFSDIGVSEPPKVRDLWHRTEVTGMTTSLSVNVPHDGALIYTLSPPGSSGGSGNGGAGGTATTAGGGGGTSAAAGASAGFAGELSGGSGNPPMPVAGAPSSGSGGLANEAGSAPIASSSSGCACSVPSGTSQGAAFGWFCGLALLVASRQRHRLEKPRAWG